MPQKVVKFGGINRKVNEFQGTGTCEELINLRPNVGGGFSIVKPKVTYRRNINYMCFYEHAFGDIYNEIAVTESGDVVWVNNSNQKLASFTGNDVTISHVNNILVVYSYKDNRQEVFRFKDGDYQKYYAAPIKLSASIDFRSEGTFAPKFVSTSGYAYDDGNIMDTARWDEAASKAQSNFHANYKNGLCGAAVVGCTYVLEDGSEVWSSAFVVADSSKARANNTTRQNDAPTISNPNDLCRVTVKGVARCSYNINFHESELEGIKKINVYATKPVYNYKFEYLDSTTHGAVKQTLDVLNLDSQLMYYQGSINVNGGGTLSLNFSIERYGENIMPVTAGAIERVGPNVSLNNRFHYFKSDVQHVVQEISMSEQLAVIDAFTPWRAYAKINNKWIRLNDTYYFNPSETQDFIYPMSGVSQIFFEKCSLNSNGSVSPLYDEGFIVEMQDSSAYNYSYAFDIIPEIERFGDAWYDEINNTSVDGKVLLRKEANVINVTLHNTPYAFDINASYNFGGEIIDVVTSYTPISAVQVNQYPVTVFTTNGIYALEQGSGEVLYQSVDPLQPFVIEGKATSTPNGIFFVSSNNLYLLSGREAANVSYVLNGPVDGDLRKLESYNLLCTAANGVANFISTNIFEQYISDVSMIYDQLHNELIISNNDEDYSYSYVLNLDTRSYHKINKKYLRSLNSNKYAIEIRDGSKILVNMFSEAPSTVPVLLQSRPMQFEPFFTHLQRLILLTDTKLEGDVQKLCLSVFGSDDLSNWKCIISAQKAKTVLRQIRTNKAPKSYRDYVILITGYVETDTDISDIIADYTVVQRRLG
jgi:hypothetical protein